MANRNIRIPLNDIRDTNVVFDLEQDFDSLDVLTLRITSSEAYARTNSDFGAVVGRVVINGGFGVKNAKISVFVPLTQDDKTRQEILDVYPFETVNDLFPNGVRYNLLPRTKQQNPDHVPVGTFPDISDLTHYPIYLEVFEKYYKYTTTTNEAGDYMIFGVPVGTQTVFMDFDLLDTPSLAVTVNDLIYLQPFGKEMLQTDQETPNIDRLAGFKYYGNQKYSVAPNTDLNAMPNIFSESKTINVLPFWGNPNVQVGITRCDFSINYNYVPTAVFFGTMLSAFPKNGWIDNGISFDKSLTITKIDKFKSLKVVVWKLNDENKQEYFGTFNGVTINDGTADNTNMLGIFNLNLPMYRDYYVMSEFGQIIPSTDGVGVPTTGKYAFEFYDADEYWNGRLDPIDDYQRFLLPGVKVPTDPYGNGDIAGWTIMSTDNSVFQYDIQNAKRKIYTLATTYTKKDKGNLLSNGNYISWLPDNRTITTPELLAGGFPLDSNTRYNNTDNTTVIGSALVPRVYMTSEVKFPNADADKTVPGNYTVNIKFPNTVISYVKPNDSYLTAGIGPQEWLLGLNVKPNGIRDGQPMSKYFKMSNTNNTSLYNIQYRTNDTETTWHYGPNGYNGVINDFDATVYYSQVKKTMYQIGQMNDEYVFDMFTTGGISDIMTSGPFINSSILNGNSGLFSTNIYEITDELPELIKGSINTTTRYSDYQYNNKRYYFGKTYETSALKAVENLHYD